MTTTIVVSRTNSVTYVADNILKTLKDIILQSGLSPAHLSDDWTVLMLGFETWLNAETLQTVSLEVYNPATDGLIRRWDLDVVYAWTGTDSGFWVDTDQIRYAIKKAGVAPGNARYTIKLQNKDPHPSVPGWGSCNFRSTVGMVRQSIGGTIEHNGLGAATSYWRKV